jgi:pyruvate kinase
MMNRIIERVERDAGYRRILNAQHPDPEPTGNDAISAAAAQVAHTLSVAAIVTYTTSGSTVLRVARERPEAPILCLTESMGTARAVALVWGAHCVHTSDLKRFSEMVEILPDRRARGVREAGRPPSHHRRRPLRHAGIDQHPARGLGRRIVYSTRFRT